MASQVKVKYEDDNGTIYSLRMSPDFAAQAGTEPTGGVSTDVKPKISKTNREHGIRPRGVRLGRTIGTAPDTFTRYTFLPVLTQTEFNSAAYAIGATITIGTTAWEVVSKQGEDF